MPNTAEKVIVVTGASSGLGKLTAQRLAAQGHVVYATMRDSRGKNRTAREELLAIGEREKNNLRVSDIDVTEDASVSLGIDAILEDTGRIEGRVDHRAVRDDRHVRPPPTTPRD